MDEYATVIGIDTEIVEEEPPLLYDLTTLQMEASRLLGLTAAETLECAQNLYEAELLTYPRTSSRYITPDMEQSVSALVSRADGNSDGNTSPAGAEGIIDGNSLGTGNKLDEDKKNKPDPEAPVAYKRELGDTEFISGTSDISDTDGFVNQSNESTKSVTEPQKLDDVIIHTSEQTMSGAELVGEQREVNERYRGDQFSERGSYEKSIDKSKIIGLIKANASTTCSLNANIDGAFNSNKNANSKLSDAQRAVVTELKKMREDVPPITEDTVMQKVISKDQYQGYIREKDPKIQVSGCASKAVDVAPYTNNLKQAYESLRLDYNGTPYKELAENKGDMYVVRFTSDYCPNNNNYPKMDETEPWNKPPCTGTGYTGSKEHLIPEYTYGRGQDISDGAIYKVDFKGKETLVAMWKHGRFEKVQ